MADQGQIVDLPWFSDFTLDLLGPVRLGNSAGDDFTPRARKTRALLAIVALSKNAVPRSRLTNLLWGDRGEEQAKASLRQALYELRALAGSGHLTANRESVRLGPKRLSTDLGLIEQRIAEDDAHGLAALLRGIDFPLLPSLDDVTPELDEWLRQERARISATIIAPSIALADRGISAGDAAVARRIADELGRLDALDERVAQLGIRADVAAGDRAAAVRRNARFAARLKDQLGLEPSDETARLLGGARDATAGTTARALPTTWVDRPRRRTRHVAGLAIILVLLVAIGSLYLFFRPLPAPAKPTVAVLPFDDFGQKNEDYFASGVSDEILNLLAHQRSMKVLGRVSAGQLARDPDSIRTARELGVTYLLDGSVRTGGNRVLVIARLTRVSDGAQLWSERYERRIGDIFAVQGDVASAVASRLVQSFAPARPQGTTPEVYDRFLAARQLVRERREVTLREAERLLREAIALDPHYAPAFAELAQVIMLRADSPMTYGSLPVVQAEAEAEPFARKAHELDPNLGDAYAAFGFLSLSFPPRAEPYFRKAVELSPQSAEFHRWHGESLLNEHQFDDSIAEFTRAVDVDPLWGLSYEHLIGALLKVGRRDEASRYLDRFLALSTDQRAKLLLLRSIADYDSRVADVYRISAQLFRAYPQERQIRLDMAATLAEMGQIKQALQLMRGDSMATAVLTSNWPAAVRAADAMGPEYWDQAHFWNLGSLLAASGHSDAIVRLYDRDRNLKQNGRVNPDDLATADTIIALRRANRNSDANTLLAELRSRTSELPDRGALGIRKFMDGATIAALDGNRETAIRRLDQLSRRDPLMLVYVPAMALRHDPAFAPLADDPRFGPIEDRVRVAMNKVRQDSGMAPIGHVAWVSNPKTVLTAN